MKGIEVTKQDKIFKVSIPLADATPKQNASFVHNRAESQWKKWRTMRTEADRRYQRASIKR
jgi:hypothetical protein